MALWGIASTPSTRPRPHDLSPVHSALRRGDRNMDQPLGAIAEPELQTVSESKPKHFSTTATNSAREKFDPYVSHFSTNLGQIMSKSRKGSEDEEEKSRAGVVEDRLSRPPGVFYTFRG
ncbi:hypothetical protein BDV93DRAFT_509788 [Ceratobasidium sp. AG-I]|nr:hypothetical protein BDV93DRAFT_509788 [Ceratobasidium sp. AG-I]